MLWSIWYLIIVLRYGGSDMKVMLVEVIMKNTCVEGCDSLSMHVWWTALWWSWSTILFIDCLPCEWQSGMSYGLFLPIYTPRSMCVVLLFLMTSKFLQWVYEFFWLMWVHGYYAHLPFRNFLASSVPCIALSQPESWCGFRWCIQTPWYDTLYHT